VISRFIRGLINRSLMEPGSAEEVLRRIEGSKRRWYLPIISGERARVLVDVVRRFRPKRILEVGTFVGYSAILMGRELGPDAEIITIEIDEDEARMARENIRDAGIEPRVEVLTGDALELIPLLDGEFDMVFLDADKWEYINYLRLVEGKLHSGSVVVADNAGSFSRSMRDYLDHVRESGLYESRFHPGRWDGVEVSVKL
jgi:predicted O-methyltransferase YrrM